MKEIFIQRITRNDEFLARNIPNAKEFGKRGFWQGFWHDGFQKETHLTSNQLVFIPANLEVINEHNV